MTGHCSFVLLAEFDIDSGAQLTFQFPQPLGSDDSLLANLMLPDGAERHLQDWTIFFLNQTPFNTISPVLALDVPHTILYVLNLVRTKHDKSLRRGAVVKAMAICTRHPFIQIFKPLLLLALDDYFANPSQDCLARLFDAINSMDISLAPVLTRAEKLILRASDRNDLFAHRFLPQPHPDSPSTHTDSDRDRDRDRDHPSSRTPSPSDDSFSLGGSAVWVPDDSAFDHSAPVPAPPSTSSTATSTPYPRHRRSTDASSSSSIPPATLTSISDPHIRPPPTTPIVKDTHFFHTTIAYKGHLLPIKMPLATFNEEVGDYSLIQLIQTFSSPALTLTGPLHPHLHTNGSLTHPIIILFNALITGKRILFLGHNVPAGQVASFVLSACALGSGCGAVLRGFVERAFPYAGLAGGEEWESVDAYIAGVTNPIFESSARWDLLMDIGTNRVVVSKDIHLSHPPTAPTTALPALAPLLLRTGTLRAAETPGGVQGEDELARGPGRDAPVKTEFAARSDSADNLFIEDLLSAISSHFGEGLVRMRFTEYVWRFVRLASRYEELALGSTKVHYPSTPFSFSDGQLGSGMVFSDDAVAAKEVTMNASRIEGWRKTKAYQYCVADFKNAQNTSSIQGFDVLHQLHRLRLSRHVSDAEVELIVRTLGDNVRSYSQVVELLSMTPPHTGGLQALGFCLFHHQETIREMTVDIFDRLRQYPIGVIFLHALNHFQRYAYVRQAHAREARVKEVQLVSVGGGGGVGVGVGDVRTSSNRSEE